MPPSHRDYLAIAREVSGVSGPIADRLQPVCDALWSALHAAGVSWLGFYIDHPGQPDDRRLVLGPHQNKPACSPIGLHGVCGRSLVSAATQIVSDVTALGPNYVACDPRDRSEIVVPLLDSSSRAWAVLDLDSWDLDAFNHADDSGLRLVLAAAGLNRVDAPVALQ